MDERADLEREAGLGADGLQQAQVGGRVGLLRSLGAEADEAKQAIASGEREKQLGAEGFERLALTIVGEEEPAVGILAVERGGLVGSREIADGRGAFFKALGHVFTEAHAVLDAEAAALTQIHGDAGNVQDLRDAAGDGLDEGLGLGKAARLIGELAQDQLGIIGLAEELAIEPALHAVTDGVVRGEELDESRGDEDEYRDGDRKIFLVPDEREDEMDEDEGDEGELGYEQRIAGERVLGAHAHEKTDIERALDHDDVGEG